MNFFFLKDLLSFLHLENNQLKYFSLTLENLFQIVNNVLQNFHSNNFEILKKEGYNLIHVFHSFFSQAFKGSYLLSAHIQFKNLVCI